MAWSFVLTRKDRTPIGEITNAFERGCKLGLSRGDTAELKLRVDHPLLPNIFAEDTMLQAYEGSTLRYWGDVLTAQLATSDDGSPPLVAVTSAGPYWRLTRRLCGLSNLTTGDVFTATYKGEIAYSLLAQQNTYAETGILVPPSPVGGVGSYTTGPYKKVSAALNDLANGYDGFEWRMEPSTSLGGAKIATFTAATIYGVTRPDVVFEYGVGQCNVRDLSYLRDVSNRTNWAAMMPENAESEAAVQLEDATSRANDGLFMELVEGAGIQDVGLRKSVVQETIEVKKTPRFVAGMTLDNNSNPSVPRLGTDYWLGDVVQARAQVYGTKVFAGYARVYGVEVKLDNNGQESVTPVLVNEGAEE